ncbi:benzoate/H(+) symporter BenE family transporter [Halalkalibacterium ligniniphilum]|uniref:benzoate/H(+) symporter BenE family transporter n=1 Tax=Halalkalibacterium ligniniphilum TaxID=1134413 RepID=UPI00034B0D3E|nr:benzoate/H(+) symporter BenE family transporter [Halalkalibacterium ligniniphilum]
MNDKNVRSNLRDLPSHLNLKTVSAGTIAAIFGCTGPALIVIGGAASGGLTHGQAISWIFSIYFFGGVLGLYLALRYRQPIAGAFSIPGAVLVAGTLSQFSLNEAAGAYLLAGVFVLFLGVTGLIGKIMHWIPIPIVMAMIVGAMIRFGTDMIVAIEVAPIIAGTAIFVFLLSSRFFTSIPPVVSAFTVSAFLAIVLNQFQVGEMQSSFILPQLVAPTFSLDAIVSIAIPLALLVIGAENAQAIGVLMEQKYKPPVNSMTIWSGIGGIVTSFFGGHNANIAGSMTAICASDEAGEKKEGRYAAVIVNGLIFITFGLLAGVVVPFVTAMPGVLIATVAGLAMIGVLLSSLQTAFSERKFQKGAFFALIIAMSGISFFNISSPFWAIIGGVVVSLILEKEHFQSNTTDDDELTKPNVEGETA